MFSNIFILYLYYNMNKVDELILKDQIIKLANRSFGINNGKPFIEEYTEEYINDTTEEPRKGFIEEYEYNKNLIKDILEEKVYIKENIIENTDLLLEDFNANLFFHPWLFPDGIKKPPTDITPENFLIEDPVERVENYENEIQINVYIGIFHPYGGIYCIEEIEHINDMPLILNQFKKFKQYIHDEHDDYDPTNFSAVRFSPNNCQFYIDPNIYGLTVGCCFNPKNNKCRIELLITLPIKNNKLSTLKYLEFDNILLKDLFDMLLKIPDLNNLLNNDSFTNIKISNKKICIIERNYKILYSPRVPKSMCIFFYGNSEKYGFLYNINLCISAIDINKNEIPYIGEIEKKLISEAHINPTEISYEFGINIINILRNYN